MHGQQQKLVSRPGYEALKDNFPTRLLLRRIVFFRDTGITKCPNGNQWAVAASCGGQRLQPAPCRFSAATLQGPASRLPLIGALQLKNAGSTGSNKLGSPRGMEILFGSHSPSQEEGESRPRTPKAPSSSSFTRVSYLQPVGCPGPVFDPHTHVGGKMQAALLAVLAG